MEYMERNGTAPQILIVDDVETNVMILESIISEMGYTPRCASSACDDAGHEGTRDQTERF